MSDVLHQENPTATQALAAGRHRRFLDSIRAQAVEVEKVVEEIVVPIVPPIIRFIAPPCDCDVCQGLTPMQVKPSIAIRDIQRAVCAHFKVSMVDLLSVRKSADIVLPRQIAVWLCRKLTPHSLPRVGAKFGNRDHTTILHSARKIEQLRQTDPVLDATLQIFLAEFADRVEA